MHSGSWVASVLRCKQDTLRAIAWQSPSDAHSLPCQAITSAITLTMLMPPAGFLQQFAAVTDDDRPHLHLAHTLKQLSGGRMPNRVICTGHSLGGALATLCALRKSSDPCHLLLIGQGASNASICGMRCMDMPGKQTWASEALDVVKRTACMRRVSLSL